MKHNLLSTAFGTLLLFSSFTASGMESDITARLIGGDKAQPNAWPFMVALTRNGATQPFCGGSLIANQYVLTAAHCVDRQTLASDLQAVVNAYNFDDLSSAVRVGVKQIYLHQNYQTAFDGDDIAILELTRAIDNPLLSVAKSADYSELNENLSLNVIGFGSRHYDPVKKASSDNPRVLHQASVPFVSLAKCKASNSSYKNLGDHVFCAGEIGVDSCQGDSGGPIMYDATNGLKQMGIVSWGVGCGLNPGVYTKVSDYQNWIEDRTAGLSYRQSKNIGIIDLAANRKHIFTFTNQSNNGIELKNPQATVNGNTWLTIIDPAKDTCSGLLSPGEQCQIEVDYSIVEYTLGRVLLEFESSDLKEGKVAAWLDYDALQPVSYAVRSYLNALPHHSAYENNHRWQVAGNVLSSATDLEANQTSELVLDNLPRGEFSFDYWIKSDGGLDSLTVYLNGKKEKVLFGYTNEILSKGSYSLEMYSASNKVRLVYHRSQNSKQSDSHVSLTELKHRQLLTDILQETLDLIRSNNSSDAGSFGIGSGLVLLAMLWLRRSRRQ